MKPRRRWLQYSLRSFLVLLTALAVWLGVIANRVREQREAVKAIRALGGMVLYDWELDKLPSGIWDVHEGEPAGPVWLRRIVGDDFFQQVRGVHFYEPSPETEPNVLKSIPHLRRLNGLKLIFLPCTVSNATSEPTVWNWNAKVDLAVSSATIDELEAAFPACDVIGFVPGNVGDFP